MGLAKYPNSSPILGTFVREYSYKYAIIEALIIASSSIFAHIKAATFGSNLV